MVVLPPIYNTSQLVLIRLIYAPFPEVAMIVIYAVICLFLGAKGCSKYICATQRYFRRSIIRQYAPFFEVAWIVIYAAFLSISRGERVTQILLCNATIFPGYVIRQRE